MSSEPPAVLAPSLVARQAELAAIRSVLDGLTRPGGDGAPSRPAAIVIQGPAGVGKTALWLAAVDAASGERVRVLRARPAEAEATHAYGALADLLRDELPALLRALPGQQRRALELALGIADVVPAVAEPTVEAQAVQAAAAGALLLLAAQQPLLIAVDDAPWLDAASAAVLQFFARRVGSRPIGFVVTQRADEEQPSPFGIDSAFPERPVVRLSLAPLTLGALHKLLEQRLGMTLPRAHLLRLHELSGGIPFHALEIARALARGPLPPIGAPLPIPVSLRELLAQRLDALPPEGRRVMLLTAAAGTLDRAAASNIMGAPAAQRGTDSAVDAGLLTVDGGRLRPAHPLVASTAYGAAGSAEVRLAHAQLVDAVDEPEAKARHRALSTSGTDEAVAAELEAAGRRLLDRGAPDSAAEQFRLAVEHTPTAERESRARRLLALAEALYRTAALPAAAQALDELMASQPSGAVAARAHIIRSEIAWYTGTSLEAVTAARAALAAAAGDHALEADVHYRLSIFHDYDAAASLEHARRAVQLLERQDRPSMLASALLMQFATEVARGYPPPVELLERALAVEPPDTRDATTIPGIWWLALDDVAAARRRFRAMLDLDRRYGQLSSEANLLTRLAEVELFADDYAAAREYAEAATAAARQQGDEPADPARRIRALIDAHVGLLEPARESAEPAARRAAEAGDRIIACAWLVVLAFVAASAERHAEVDLIAIESAAHLAAIGTLEPLRLGTDHERAESLVALGRLAEAEGVIAALEERQSRIPRPWLLAALVRARAALAMAHGRTEAAIAETQPVLDPTAAAWRPFDRARTLLVRGSILRRARARREAAAALDGATAIFDRIGAQVWAGRARAESDRLGRHRPGSEALTPSEQQVAELAASGLTNREVAERLSLSPKTVEAHLARSYAKLGIRSRAELGRLMAARDR